MLDNSDVDSVTHGLFSDDNDLVEASVEVARAVEVVKVTESFITKVVEALAIAERRDLALSVGIESLSPELNGRSSRKA